MLRWTYYSCVKVTPEDEGITRRIAQAMQWLSVGPISMMLLFKDVTPMSSPKKSCSF
jgi:hypothetical protein